MVEQRKAMKERYFKLNNQAGFTLAETLLAILILLMVSAIVATGVPSAKNAYEKVVLASNAQVLLSTAMTELRNELGTAINITKGSNNDNSELYYTNSFTGTKSRIYKSTDGTIMVERNAGVVDGVPLISKQAATGDLYVTYASIVYNTGSVTVSGLSVNRTSGTTGLTRRDTFSIHVLSP